VIDLKHFRGEKKVHQGHLTRKYSRESCSVCLHIVRICKKTLLKEMSKRIYVYYIKSFFVVRNNILLMN
jgi:hypothetical protein